VKTAVLTPELDVRIDDRPRPDPGPNEVLVRVGAVGVCGSDVHYWQRGRIGDYVVEDDLVLGHEAAGEVVSAGEAVDSLASGDRVALEPGVPCGRCRFCRRGAYNQCPDVTFMATPPDDGALCEFVAWPADFAYRLPDAVSTVSGALCESLSVGSHACRRGSVGVGDSVLVTGAGPIGDAVVTAACAAGATDVTVSDVVDAKLSRVAERGATRTLRGDAVDVPAAVRAALGADTGPSPGAGDAPATGVDVAVEASGSEAGFADALASVRRGGTVVVVGLPEARAAPVDVHRLVDSELDVRGSFRYRDTYHAAVDLVWGGRADPAAAVDAEFGLDGVREAFERARDPETVKVAVRP
jgi:L-iditol 2-dehydrogenase